MQKKRLLPNLLLLLEEGEKNRSKRNIIPFSGGGATNAAVSFKKQNIDVSFLW